jgi:hypothetical protein
MIRALPGDSFDDLAAGLFDTSIPDDNSGSSPDMLPASSMELVFRLWAFDAARDPGKASRLLYERTGVKVSPATLRRWSVELDWPDKARNIHQTYEQYMADTVLSHLSFGSVKAVAYLVSVLDDEDASATAKVKAAGMVLNMAGYVAMPPGASSVSVNVHASRDAWRDVSDEELEAMAREYQSSVPVSPPIDVDSRDIALSQPHNTGTTTPLTVRPSPRQGK